FVREGAGIDPGLTFASLRHLRWLTRPVTLAGPQAHAIAVYAAPDIADPDAGYLLCPAQEQGVEGVACLDDAARAIVLYCRLWREHGSRPARVAAYRLLRFLAHMQDEDGRFANFILDWTGQKNVSTTSSVPGGLPWQSRALH